MCRASQGRKFRKGKSYKPEKYLLRESAQGDPPVRCPNRCVFVHASLRPFSLAVAFLWWCGGGGDVKQSRDVVCGKGCDRVPATRHVTTVLQSITQYYKVLLCSAEYYKVFLRTTQYYSVRRSFFQSTIKILHSDTNFTMRHTSRSQCHKHQNHHEAMFTSNL